MSAVASHIQHTLLGWTKLLLRSKPVFCDETTLFTDDQLRFLASRGVIYLTVQPSGEFSTIIAQDAATAANIAFWRNAQERVLGQMGFGFLRHLRDPSLQWGPMRDPEVVGEIASTNSKALYASDEAPS
ncbi:hypothetical protein [Bradyrhizobium sp. ARR65]|uniref:hypothetical protein n=1 Tax=Bradyrhizobium sp. ARR65 TaxID=1040989 RepID=UPI0004666026|nr:hypothetical protein [Bradyrhizobium sp. ARR65]